MKNNKIMFACVVLCISICGCGTGAQKEITETETTAIEDTAKETTATETMDTEATATEITTAETTVSETTATGKAYDYKYNSHIILPQFDSALSDEERSAAFSLIDAIEAGKSASPVKGLSEDASYKVWYAVRLSDPLSALVDDNTIEYANDQLVFQYKYDSEEVKKRIQDWHTLINKIVAENILESDNEKEKSKKIFDYISQNISYNYDVLGDANAIDNLSAYGALTEGTGICYNYSLAYAFIAEQCGLTCYIVETDGVTPGSEGHAWNMIRIDGKFYHLDTTWASTNLERMDSHFGLSDKQRKKALKENELSEDFYIRNGQVRDATMEAPKCEESL